MVDNRMVYDPGMPQVDALIGSWSPDNQSLIYTRVEYVVLNNRYVRDKTFIERVGANGGTPERLFAGNGRESYPDWQMVDTSVPKSTMTPLPALLQNGSFELSWQGADVGPAGLAAFDVDFQLAGSNTWTPLLTHTLQTSVTLVGEPGTTVHYRVRGIDRVGNAEAAATSGAQTTSVTFYHWAVPMGITDVRGYPVPQAQLHIDPAPLLVAPAQPGADGRSISLLGLSGRRTLTATAAALAGPLVMTQYVDSNAAVSLVLAPADNLIINGGFEDQGATPPGWHIDWAGQPNFPGSNAYSGNAGITLGSAQSCALPCLTLSTSMPLHNLLDLDVSSDGTLHVVSAGDYWTRTRGGPWMGPIDISHGFNASYGASYISLDTQEQPHIIFSGLNGMWYTHRDATGHWSDPERVSSVIDPVNTFQDLVVDHSNNVHVLYSMSGRMTYRKRMAHGSWQPEVTFDLQPGSLYGHGFFTKGIDNSIHLILANHIHLRITKDGSMMNDERLPMPVYRMVVGPDGIWNAFWSENGSVLYAFKKLGPVGQRVKSYPITVAMQRPLNPHPRLILKVHFIY